MATYTVYQPPIRAAHATAEAERFAFVRDGFSGKAFLFAPLWMLYHRMWLVLAGYVIAAVVLALALTAVGASDAIKALTVLVIEILLGLEASTLRRFSLRRRGWQNIGIVSGADLEDAERRFFAAWLQSASGAASARVPPAGPAPAAYADRAETGPDVIGLFPQSGAPR